MTRFWPHYTDDETIIYGQKQKEILKMPHDKNGKLVSVGDTVTVQFIVTGVQQNDEFCNVNLETLIPMHPGVYKTHLTANAGQCHVESVAAVASPSDSGTP